MRLERPEGATGIRWKKTGQTTCFHIVDEARDWDDKFEFTSDPALTGGDDCACDSHIPYLADERERWAACLERADRAVETALAARRRRRR